MGESSPWLVDNDYRNARYVNIKYGKKPRNIYSSAYRAWCSRYKAYRSGFLPYLAIHMFLRVLPRAQSRSEESSRAERG